MVSLCFNIFENLAEGHQYPQGDHSIFVQNGCPAIAVSSKWLIENLDNQDITHTAKDNIEIIDIGKVVEIAKALDLFIRRLTNHIMSDKHYLYLCHMALTVGGETFKRGSDGGIGVKAS